MKNSLKLLSLGWVLVLTVLACTKVADLPFYDRGRAVTLTTSFTTVVSTQADSNRNVVSFSWTNPQHATDSSNYKFVLSIDSAGRSFAREVTKTVMGARSTTLTGRELNNILLNYGFAVGRPHTLEVKVTSSYGNNNEKLESNVVRVTVTPFDDPAVLTTQNTILSPTLAVSNNPGNTFSWSRSFPGYTGNITYTLQYDSAGKNFATPRDFPVGTNLLNVTLTNFEMNETALNDGVVGGTTGRIEYRVRAVTAQGAVSFSNAVSVTINTYVPILRFYMPGGYQSATGNGNNWDPNSAPELIRDIRPEAMNKLYYIYLYLPANSEFKVTQGRSWDINYGGTNNNLAQNGANFSVSTAGVYRISIDRANMKYDIREGRMGFVGGATGANWNPGASFPDYAMGHPEKNLFVGLTNLNNAGGWKLIDNNGWNSGDITAANARSYGANGGSGSTMQVNGPNMPDVSTSGRYRVIWDGRDVNNIKYEISPATEMRLVGDGITGVSAWNPGASPSMTYVGAGVWTISVALEANKDIKFLAGNNWGAFDYEDASGGSQSVGTPRRIKWDGGPNFKTPTTARTYTITLNENLQTVTIN
jgi:starch-binding outer membrane protein SusE/F